MGSTPGTMLKKGTDTKYENPSSLISVITGSPALPPKYVVELLSSTPLH